MKTSRSKLRAYQLLVLALVIGTWHVLTSPTLLPPFSLRSLLTHARGAVRYDRLRAYSIWLVGDGDAPGVRVEHCEPYDGNDDRALQGMGLPNRSEM